MKKISVLILSVLFGLCQNLYSKQAFYSCEDYSLSLTYNEKAFAGEAVFVRMKLIQTSAGSKKAKILKKDVTNTEASIELMDDGKAKRNSTFFEVARNPRNAKTSVTLLAGIPLSTYMNSNSKYQLKISYEVFGAKKEFSLPFSLEGKTFLESDITKSEPKGSRKTDTSVKIMEQTKRLNTILESKSMHSYFHAAEFSLPVDSGKRTGSFGERRNFKYPSGDLSTRIQHGLDFEIPSKTEIKACAEGKVVFVDDRINSGWTVAIEHMSGLYSLYGNLGEPLVKEGDLVKQGQTLALSQETESNTCIHWEIRLNKEAVDPDFFTENFSFAEEQKVQ